MTRYQQGNMIFGFAIGASIGGACVGLIGFVICGVIGGWIGASSRD